MSTWRNQYTSALRSLLEDGIDDVGINVSFAVGDRHEYKIGGLLGDGGVGL